MQTNEACADKEPNITDDLREAVEQMLRNERCDPARINCCSCYKIRYFPRDCNTSRKHFRSVSTQREVKTTGEEDTENVKILRKKSISA